MCKALCGPLHVSIPYGAGKRGQRCWRVFDPGSSVFRGFSRRVFRVLTYVKTLFPRFFLLRFTEVPRVASGYNVAPAYPRRRN